MKTHVCVRARAGGCFWCEVYPRGDAFPPPAGRRGHGWPWGGQCHLLANPLRFHTGICSLASGAGVFLWAGAWRGGLLLSPSIPAGAPEGLLTPWVALKGQRLLEKIEIEEEMKQKLLPSLPLLLAAREGKTPWLGDAHRSPGLLGPHVQVNSMALPGAQQRICSRNLGS